MRPGRAADHSPPSSAADTEDPLGHTGPVTGTLYLFFLMRISLCSINKYLFSFYSFSLSIFLSFCSIIWISGYFIYAGCVISCCHSRYTNYLNFIYPPTDAPVSCLKKIILKFCIKNYIKNSSDMFRCYSYTIIRERINLCLLKLQLLNYKQNNANFNVNFNIYLLKQLSSASVGE